ncbi:MAG: phytanoyl-CoA dioxygenase family protein [Phycisphaerae bacterium]
MNKTVSALGEQGLMVVEHVMDDALLTETRAALYLTRDRIHADVGADRLSRAGELVVLRLMAKYDAFFLKLLAIPEMTAVVDATVSNTAVLHLQNGFILSSLPPDDTPSIFQNRFHQDFPRVLNGFPCSVNCLFAIDAFTAGNGGTLVIPGSHQRADRPSDAECRAQAAAVECPAGSMIVFDSTLWHAAGRNTSGRDRLGVNHQFTRSYVKQQIDLVRALGDDVVRAQPPRTQQLLGWYTRVPTSLDEFYQPPEHRLYRPGQG